MYALTVQILLRMREDILRKFINCLLDFGIEKREVIHVFDFYFTSLDYDLTLISLKGLKEFLQKNESTIKAGQYYREDVSDIMARLDEEDMIFIERTGYKTDNHLKIEIDTCLYEYIVKEYGIGEELRQE